MDRYATGACTSPSSAFAFGLTLRLREGGLRSFSLSESVIVS